MIMVTGIVRQQLVQMEATQWLAARQITAHLTA
jgi:hypothetical protein